MGFVVGCLRMGDCDGRGGMSVCVRSGSDAVSGKACV